MKQIELIILALSLMLCINCGNKTNGNQASQDTIDNAINEITNEGSDEKPVIIQGDTLKIEFPYFLDNGDTVFEPIVSLGTKIIYDFRQDKIYSYYGKSSIKIIVFKNTTYLLLSVNGTPLLDKWLVIEISNHKKISIYKNVLQNILQDIDKDGIIEVGGQELTEAACLDCDSVYYSPYNIYKLGNTLIFDSLNSRKLTEKLFGLFLGYEALDTIVEIKNNIEY
jgi:hypothetical protein